MNQLSLDQARQREIARHNYVQEQETHRSNITRESIDQINATASLLSGSGSLLRGLTSALPHLSSSVKQLTTLKEVLTHG
nr:putative ORF1 [Marmot picobirnavirus]